ncbi:MAG: ASPIC/UnbV domain-containing protein [Acidobacteria bacterium]|nr:ASPIC/UnbV domain-containing protein [Acidobacteriota bacterium]
MSRSPQALGTGRSPADYVAGWQATLRLLRQGKSWSGTERNCVFLNISGLNTGGLNTGGLNTGDLRFADVSAVSGLDFPDDGRGLAVVDWDGDGDLDLWLANRTAPRLRLMLNQGESKNSFVALRLRGTRSNRDAIGARAEVELAPDPHTMGSALGSRLVRTIYAGDAFLSQSSKWLHFGLGTAPVIKRVTVRWPGGKRETFAGVRPGGRYLLVEGTGAAVAVTAREPRPQRALASAPQASSVEPGEPGEPEAPAVPPAPDTTERVLLPVRVPLPRLLYKPLDAVGPRAVETGSGPLLINLWASWCVPCVAELREFSERAEELRATGLGILALSVDGLDRDQITKPADANRLLEELEFPFPAGYATPELLEKIELLQETLFERSLPFAVPASLLLDGAGELAATYRGRTDVDRLLLDLKSLGESRVRLQAASAPLPGRWIAPLPGPDLESLAKRFGVRFPEDAERYLRLALDRLAARNAEPMTPERVRRRSEQEAGLRLSLANAVLKQDRREEAIVQLRRAIDLEEDLGRAHATLAAVLRSSEPEAAIDHYRRAVEIDPADAEAQHGLGVTLRTAGRLDEALRHLAIAQSLRPDWPAPLIPMAWILIGHPEPNAQRAAEAVRFAERAVALSEDRHPVALDTLAAAYAAAGRPTDAIATAREALDSARARSDDVLAAGIQSRLLRYRSSSSAPTVPN